MTKNITAFIFIGTLLTLSFSCDKDEELNKPVTEVPFSTDTLDIFIRENFVDPYGVAVRFKYVDRYVDGDKRVAPASRDVIKPMLNFLTDFWIEPFVSVPNGDQFFKSHVPAEIVFIGSSIYNSDGTLTLGTADAGARITLTEVNDINTTNPNWVFRQLGTIYHEFAHIMHQRYNLPSNFREISPEGYTGPGSWYNVSESEALERGFVSPYATSSFNEDFAETVAFILYHPNFYEIYYDDETPNCTTPICEGRALIRKKYAAVLAHYKQYTGVDLLAVREIIQAKFE